MGNEGKALVLAPADAMPPPGETAGDPSGAPAASPPPSRPAKQPASQADDQVAIHLARIAELEHRIMELRTDLEASRLDVERGRSERHGERERADRVTAELAEIAKQFATMTATATATAEARARETAIEAKLDAARAEMAALQGRPWWARMVRG